MARILIRRYITISGIAKIDGRYAEDPTPFERRPNGLVDLACYEPYLVDAFENVPLQPATHLAHKGDWVSQHVYFRGSTYRQLDLPEGQRDPNLNALRESPYSQIYMRSAQEFRLHREMETNVDPPPASTVEAVLEDYRDIDLAGIATIGLRDALGIGWHPLPRHDSYRDISDRTRIGVFQAEQKKAFESLENPRVLPHRIVASALKRLAMTINDHRLARIAHEHLAPGETFFPLRTQKTTYLRHLGRAMLLEAVAA